MPKTIISILGTSGAFFNFKDCTPQTHDDGSIKYQSAKYLSGIFELENREYKNSTHFLLENFSSKFVFIGTECAISFQKTILKESLAGKDVEYISIGDNSLDDIFEAVLELLQHHDDVMLDITHGFRHQPIMAIFASTLSQFLQRNELQIIFAKEVKTHKVYEYIYLDSYIEITQISLLLTGFIRTLNFIPVHNMKLLDNRVFENFSKSLLANDLKGVEKHHELLNKELVQLENNKALSHLSSLLDKVKSELAVLENFENKAKYEKYLILSRMTVEKNYLVVALAYVFESLRTYSEHCFNQVTKGIRYKDNFAKKQDIMNAILNSDAHFKNNKNKNIIYIEHKGFYEKNKSSLDRVGRVYLEIRKLRNQLAHINESKDFEDIKKMVFGYIFKVESIYKDDVLSSLRG